MSVFTYEESGMEAINNFFENMFGAMGGIVMIAFMLSYSVGTLYWVWMAIKLESFIMFLVLMLFPPSMIIIGPVGMYSLVFGIPDWIISMFS